MSDESTYEINGGTYDIVEPDPVAETARNDFSSTVPENLFCLRCGYALRGLRTTDQCPECGAPVGNSLAGPLLVASDVMYLRKLERGAYIVRACLIVLLAVFAIFVLIVCGLTGLGPVVSVIQVGNGVAALIGWWMLSEPDPAFRSFKDPGGVSRKVLRITLVIQLCAMIANLGGNLTRFFVPVGGVGTAAQIIQLLSMLAILAWFIQIFAGLTYISRLADRIPDTGIAHTAEELRSQILITLIIGIAGVAIAIPVAMLVSVFMCVFFLGAIGYLIWAVVLCVFMYNLMTALCGKLQNVITAAKAIG
ncbi:MAG: hypothetical protein H6815_06910 [Phycisphaeraceae bacterium]|nr:hypothetical protein [Phycisphaerales bacterium]MCB9860169.1 hypothetical protein [Phycisphaeraceae bacterium]